MAKKKNRTKFPKRLAGVKIPKGFRRFADSPVGGNLVAAGILYSAYQVANSDTAGALMARIKQEVSRADSAMHRFADDRKAKRRTEDFGDNAYSTPAN